MAEPIREPGNGVRGTWRAPFAREIRDLGGLPKVLAAAGGLEARLATTTREILRAQKLRYRVFFEEGGAVADPKASRMQRDVCPFDRVCDHLIVVDVSRPRSDGDPEVVGAYRLLRQSVAEANFGFYSAREFEIGALLVRNPDKRFLELGRSCVAEGYRGKRTLELLWRGIWAYALHHGVDVMIGCASFPGAAPELHAAALAYLRAESGECRPWSVDALPGRAAPAGSAPTEGVTAQARAIHRSLPPLIKGYWRLGAKFSREAVVDAAFGTTDVLVVLPIEDIRARYLAHFAPPETSASIAA